MWYENKKNLLELAEFLVESEELTTAKDLLEYFKNPERYNEVWETYQQELLGKTPSRPHNIKSIPVMMALAEK